MDDSPSEDQFTVTSVQSDVQEIFKGLACQSFERIGGAVCEMATGQIIAFLREVGDSRQALSNVASLLRVAAGFSPTNFGGSILNFGVATMEFSVIEKRVQNLEDRLKKTQEVLEQLNQKLDLASYASFRTALDLAHNAFTMVKPENRESMAKQAIDRLTEARHQYSSLIENRLDARGPAVDAYLATLTLALVAEIRCYLELEELNVAKHRLDSGLVDLERHVRTQLNTLLTSNPAAYLHPTLKGKVDLRRLTKVLHWLNPSLDENAVFEEQRQNLFSLTKQLDEWLKTLPKAVWDPVFDAPGHTRRSKKPWGGLETPELSFNVPKYGKLKVPSLRLPGLGQADEADVFARLGTILESMETMIEDMNRLRAYRTEIQAVSELGVSFHEWQQLKPPTRTSIGDLSLMCIIPKKPLYVTASPRTPN